MFVIILKQMSSQQVLQLWKSQLPHYQKIIARCVRSLLTPLTRFLPSDFDARIQEFKEILDTREIENYQNYLDIIVHYIQGVHNKSNIQLADWLVQQLGGSLLFWQNVILDVAQNTNYAGEISIWHIRKVFDQKLYIDAQNLSNYRRMSKICRSYMMALKNLVKSISKFDKKKDTIAKIDELFKKVKDNQSKYIQFTELTKVCEPSSTMDDVSNNVSMWSRQNAIKNMFNFPKMNKQNSQKSKNTLFNYNFKKTIENNSQYMVSQPTTNIKIINQILKGQDLKEFQSNLKQIKQNDQDMDGLRNAFKGMSQNYRSKNVERNNIQYANICDKEWFMSFQNYYADLEAERFSSFVEPCRIQEFLNYEIDDEEYLNEIIGEDVDDAGSEMSSFSDMSCASFIVSDGHNSQQLDLQGTNKPTYQYKFGDQWSFSPEDHSTKKEKLSLKKYQIIFPQNPKSFPLPLQQHQYQDYQRKLMNIVDGNDKKSILELISKQKYRISKHKVDIFLRKYCSKVKGNQNSKIVYRIKEKMEIQEQKVDVQGGNQKENRSWKKSESGESKIRESDEQFTTGEQSIRRSDRIRTKKSKQAIS